MVKRRKQKLSQKLLEDSEFEAIQKEMNRLCEEAIDEIDSLDPSSYNDDFVDLQYNPKTKCYEAKHR